MTTPPPPAAEPVSRNGYPRIMSGGEPSSIKRDHPCAASPPAPRLAAEEFYFYANAKGGLLHVSGTVPQMAAQDVFPGGGPGPHHRHPPAPGGRGPHGPRLSVHRHPGHRQNHLRPDPGQGRQLPAPGGRGPLQPVRGLPGHRQRLPAGRDGAGRRQQQPGGRHPGAARASRYTPPRC